MVLMKKVDHMQEQMGNFSKMIKTIRKKKSNANVILKSTVRKMKNAFDSLISRLDRAK